MNEDNGTESGGLDSAISNSNDMFSGDAIEETMGKVFDDNQDPRPTERSRDEQGKFTNEDGTQTEEPEENASEQTETELESKEEGTDESSTDSEGSQEDAVPTRDLPLGWDKAQEEDWKAMTPAMQDQFIKRNNQFAAKIQQSVEGKKFADTIKQVEAPYQAMIAAEGANTITAYQDYLKNSALLRTGSEQQKVDFVMNLSKMFNIPLNGLNPTLGNQSEEGVYVDPDIQALQNTIQGLNGKIDQMEQRTLQQQQVAQNAEIQEIDGEIANFAADPKHEHFTAVRSVMGALMTSGAAGDMEEAYDMAVHADPKLRTDALARSQKLADTERTKRAQAEADKAERTAGTNLKSRGGSGKKLNVAKTMDETMNDTYDRAMSR